MKFLSNETPRTIEDIDRLARSMNYLAKTLGEGKAKEVEVAPEEFYNGNKFRYYQVKGYHRSIPFAFVTTLSGVFALGGYRNSNRILKTRPLSVFLSGVLIFLISQKQFERSSGYNTEDYMAHTYAKYLIMTRNLKIKG